MKDYFSGEKLWGDDLTDSEVEEWYRVEQEAYSELIKRASREGSQRSVDINYEYHAWNWLHGFRYLPKGVRFQSCLGVGAASGVEFLPIIKQVDSIDILEPSKYFHRYLHLSGIPIRYHFPNPKGLLAFDDKKFDLITCFGCLHHIPNVTYVLSELYRVCKVNGILLVREPITSMGDWRQHRADATPNERGIPLQLFDSIIKRAGFSIIKKHLCNFPVIPRIWNKFFSLPPYNSVLLSIVDYWWSNLLYWNITYHRTSFWRKLAPGSIFYVLKRAM